MKKIQFIIFIIICTLLFSSCSNLTLNTEELMRPPQLTEDQREIFDALERALGSDSDIKLKYPRSGDHRSAFVFHDIDADGEDEAFVFYSLDSEDAVTRINLLDRIDGVWQSIYTSSPDMFADVSNDIDFISFANISPDSNEEIIVGWTSPNYASSKVKIYTYDIANQQLVSQYTDSYRELLIDDLNGDGRDDLFLIKNTLDTTQAYWVGATSDNRSIRVLSNVMLQQDIRSFYALTLGSYAPGRRAVFIDEYRNDTYLATEVIAIEDLELTNLLGQAQHDAYLFTYRNLEVACQDINMDGILEIPHTTYLPGYDDTNLDAIYRTDFMQIQDDGLQRMLSGVINNRYRYMFVLPETWLSEEYLFTVQNQPETGEWRFYLYDQELERIQDELLRIRVYASTDVKDKLEMEQYTLLGKRGQFEFYVYIPDTESEFVLDLETVKSLFVWID